MAEYIEREAVNALIEAECSPKVAAFLNHAIDNIPAADVRPVVRGKWKHDKDGLVWCLNCGFGKERSDERTYHFCPNCGAMMEES